MKFSCDFSSFWHPEGPGSHCLHPDQSADQLGTPCRLCALLQDHLWRDRCAIVCPFTLTRSESGWATWKPGSGYGIKCKQVHLENCFFFFFFSAPKYTATMNYVTPGSLKFPLTLFIQVGIALSRSSLCPGASLQPPSTTSNPEWITPSPCTLSLAVGTVQPAVGQFPSIIKQVQTSCLGWHRVIYEDGYHSILRRYFSSLWN